MAGQYHEPRELLSTEAIDIKRAIDSMMEELEAVDWYRQRLQAADDPQLRAILDHHQREEVEHFSMLLEWLRRNDSDFAQQLREYLFSEGSIVEGEEQATSAVAATDAAEEPAGVVTRRSSRRQTIGSLKEGS